MTPKIGCEVLIVGPSAGGDYFEIERQGKVVASVPGAEHRYQVRFRDGELAERLIHPMSQLLGARRYVAVVNASIAEQARFDAVDAETVDSDAGTGTNYQTTTYNVSSVAAQPPG